MTGKSHGGLCTCGRIDVHAHFLPEALGSKPRSAWSEFGRRAEAGRMGAPGGVHPIVSGEVPPSATGASETLAPGPVLAQT